MFPLNVISALGGGERHDTVMTAGDAFGLTIGYFKNSYGSLNPDVPVFQFGEISFLASTTISGEFSFTILDINIPDTDASWKQIEIEGVFDSGQATNIYLRADRVFYDNDDQDGGSRWEFTEQGIMVTGNIYNVVIER